MEEISRFNIRVNGLLNDVRRHFRDINEDDGLTPEDRQRLKMYYLEHPTTPRAKELLHKYFPEEFRREQSSAAHTK